VPDPLSPLAPKLDPRGIVAPPDATPRLLKAVLPLLLLPRPPSLPPLGATPLTVPLALAPGVPGPSSSAEGEAAEPGERACCSESFVRHDLGPSHVVQAELARPPAAFPRNALGTTDSERLGPRHARP
jgi:hypothetical protein